MSVNGCHLHHMLLIWRSFRNSNKTFVPNLFYAGLFVNRSSGCLWLAQAIACSPFDAGQTDVVIDKRDRPIADFMGTNARPFAQIEDRSFSSLSHAKLFTSMYRRECQRGCRGRTPQYLTCRGPSVCWTPAITATQSRANDALFSSK